MSSVNYRPLNEAEGLIHGVFAHLEREADPRIAQLRYENQLRRFVELEKGGRASVRAGSFAPRDGRTPHMRPAFKLLAVLASLFILASWAGEITLPGWDDGQQITVPLPDGFSEGEYMHWVALIANRSQSLADRGGHSLIVDMIPSRHGGYLLQLSVLGVDFTTANEWFREVLRQTPELAVTRYQITQPQVSYEITVREMLAYRLGNTDLMERRVVNAWTLPGEAPTHKGMIYLIAADGENYPRRASMLRK
jgi:hypothetical protein